MKQLLLMFTPIKMHIRQAISSIFNRRRRASAISGGRTKERQRGEGGQRITENERKEKKENRLERKSAKQ